MNTNGAQTHNVDPTDPKMQATLEVQFDTETLTAMLTVMKDLAQRLGEAEEAIRGFTSTLDEMEKFTGGRA